MPDGVDTLTGAAFGEVDSDAKYRFRITDGRERDSGLIPLGTNGKSFKDELNEADSELRRTLRANGFFMPDDMKMNDAFYRYPRADPYNYVDGAREYLFFTKPDLPLLDTSGNLIYPANQVAYFADLFQSTGYRKSVFGNLCQSYGYGHNCPFMRILSNRKASNMDIPDIQVEELETAVNMFGTKILYPKSSLASDEGVDFSIDFEDTRFTEVYHLWKVYDVYRQLKWEGLLGPSIQAGRADVKDAAYDNRYANFTYYKLLYDHFSVFKFLVAMDGETILYMAKATGVYARSIARSTFSEIPDRGPLKITIGFKVSGWLEDSTPDIVRDFNMLIQRWIGKDPVKDSSVKVAPIYDSEIDYVSQELVKAPFIYRSREVPSQYTNLSRLDEFYTYKLCWIPWDNSTSGD